MLESRVVSGTLYQFRIALISCPLLTLLHQDTMFSELLLCFRSATKLEVRIAFDHSLNTV